MARLKLTINVEIQGRNQSAQTANGVCSSTRSRCIITEKGTFIFISVDEWKNIWHLSRQLYNQILLFLRFFIVLRSSRWSGEPGVHKLLGSGPTMQLRFLSHRRAVETYPHVHISVSISSM